MGGAGGISLPNNSSINGKNYVVNGDYYNGRGGYAGGGGGGGAYYGAGGGGGGGTGEIVQYTLLGTYSFSTGGGGSSGVCLIIYQLTS
jgi:hypothetical protein